MLIATLEKVHECHQDKHWCTMCLHPDSGRLRAAWHWVLDERGVTDAQARHNWCQEQMDIAKRRFQDWGTWALLMEFRAKIARRQAEEHGGAAGRGSAVVLASTHQQKQNKRRSKAAASKGKKAKWRKAKKKRTKEKKEKRWQDKQRQMRNSSVG